MPITNHFSLRHSKKKTFEGLEQYESARKIPRKCIVTINALTSLFFENPIVTTIKARIAT